MAEHDKKRLERLKEQLVERKRKLWTELREEIFARTGEGLHTQFEIPQDVGDMGLLDLLQDAGLNVADIRRQELTQMEEAERKLNEGTYGICDGCGSDIDEKRMELMPYAVYCVECQARREPVPYPPGVKM
ncbi:MAG: TraR/DksA family transcriptional regulator [Geobacter sp.]|nr:TraR/DksA family transcriptional regulator [Geobacter sp.]